MIRRLRAALDRWRERCDARWRRALQEHWPSSISPQQMDSAPALAELGSRPQVFQRGSDDPKQLDTCKPQQSLVDE